MFTRLKRLWWVLTGWKLLIEVGVEEEFSSIARVWYHPDGRSFVEDVIRIQLWPDY